MQLTRCHICTVNVKLEFKASLVFLAFLLVFLYKLNKHNLTGINEVLKVLAVLCFLNETMPDVPLSTLFLCLQLHIHCRDMRHFTEYWSKCQSIPLRTNSLYDRRLV